MANVISLFSEYKFHQYLSLDTSKLLVQYKDQHIAKGFSVKHVQGSANPSRETLVLTTISRWEKKIYGNFIALLCL